MIYFLVLYFLIIGFVVYKKKLKFHSPIFLATTGVPRNMGFVKKETRNVVKNNLRCEICEKKYPYETPYSIRLIHTYYLNFQNNFQ